MFASINEVLYFTWNFSFFINLHKILKFTSSALSTHLSVFFLKGMVFIRTTDIYRVAWVRSAESLLSELTLFSLQPVSRATKISPMASLLP